MSKRGQVFPAICGIVLFGVAAPPATLGASFDGTYTGKRVLMKGNTPSCPAEDNVSATIQNDTVIFTNSALKSFGIGFNVLPDGSFNEVDTETGGAVVTIRGRIVGNTLDADVVNGPCEHHWHLQKVPG